MDLIAPRYCSVCGNRLGVTEEVICLNCLLEVPRTHYAEQPADNPMAQLFWGHIPVERAVAWFYYQPAAPHSRMIYDLKYHQHEEIGHFIGRVAAEELDRDHFFDGIDLLIPIPLTKRRQRKRGYNQSRAIAVGISNVTNIPILDSAVLRTHFEESQTHKNAQERRRNVEGAFELTDSQAVSGRHVLVVDDVITTGATMISCCKELLKVPDVRVSIFSVGFTKS